MNKGRQKDPRIGVFCRCGAQWFGRTVSSAAPVIEGHAAKCGPAVPAQTFELMGHRLIWPSHWTDEERQAARHASLEAVRRVG